MKFNKISKNWYIEDNKIIFGFEKNDKDYENTIFTIN